MASTYLQRTQTAGNQKTWTYSVWVKRSDSGEVCLWSIDDGSDFLIVRFNSTNYLEIREYDGSEQIRFITSARYTDVSGWYHVVLKCDTTQSVEADRFKMFVNGTQITDFSTSTYPAEDDLTRVGWNGTIMRLGVDDGTGNYYDGYMAQAVLTDGYAYDASTFGSTDATTGEWKPKSDGEIRSAVTFGTNGFLLPFSNASYLGYDYQSSDRSGTTNDFTSSGEGYQTQTNPSNNFCTWNSMTQTPGTGGSLDLNNPYGLTYFGTSNQQKNGLTATLGIFGGKWYWEGKVVNPAGTSQGVTGVANTRDASLMQRGNEFPGEKGVGYSLVDGDTFVDGTQASYGNSLSKDDFFAIALDLDNKAMYFSKNGTWQNSGDPTSGATKTGAIDISAAIATGDLVLPTSGDGSGSQHTYTAWNFGDGYFKATAAGASNADDNGQGVFKYDVPAGYYAICTKNIKAYGG